MTERRVPADGRPPSETAGGASHPDSTSSLIDRARAGDASALECLFARHRTPLERWASHRLPQWARDICDTDDLVQDTLLKTFKRIDRFEPRHGGALQAYLRQAVLNHIRDELKRKGRRPVVTGLDDDVHADSADSPLERAIGRETVECYERALSRLTSDEREAIIARVEMGHSYEEMAEALGKPTADAARKAAKRALVRLAEEMKRGG